MKFPRATHRNIYVKTQRAGERVMESVREFLEQKLKLKVNPKKSKVDKAQRVKFLGFSFYKHKGEMLIRVANRSLERFREKLRRLTKRSRSGKLEEIIREINTYTVGWIGYYRQANTPSVYEGLDGWIRRRLRQMVWKRWKRGTTRYRELVRLGVPMAHVRLTCGKRSPEQWILSRDWAEEHQSSVSGTTYFLMNRRMRTRMSGGVRGGRLAAALLLDVRPAWALTSG